MAHWRSATEIRAELDELTRAIRYRQRTGYIVSQTHGTTGHSFGDLPTMYRRQAELVAELGFAAQAENGGGSVGLIATSRGA